MCHCSREMIPSQDHFVACILLCTCSTLLSHMQSEQVGPQLVSRRDTASRTDSHLLREGEKRTKRESEVHSSWSMWTCKGSQEGLPALLRFWVFPSMWLLVPT